MATRTCEVCTSVRDEELMVQVNGKWFCCYECVGVFYSTYTIVLPNTINTHITTATTTVCKASAGKLHSVILNKPRNSSSTITIYDNTSASGTIIGEIEMKDVFGNFDYMCPFSIGLTVKTSSECDVSVIFE